MGYAVVSTDPSLRRSRVRSATDRSAGRARSFAARETPRAKCFVMPVSATGGDTRGAIACFARIRVAVRYAQMAQGGQECRPCLNFRGRAMPDRSEEKTSELQ